MSNGSPTCSPVGPGRLLCDLLEGFAYGYHDFPRLHIWELCAWATTAPRMV